MNRHRAVVSPLTGNGNVEPLDEVNVADLMAVYSRSYDYGYYEETRGVMNTVTVICIIATVPGKIVMLPEHSVRQLAPAAAWTETARLTAYLQALSLS